MRGEHMNNQHEHIHEHIMTKWGRLYEQDFASSPKEREELIEELQKTFHLSREEAVSEVESFLVVWKAEKFM